MASERQGKNHQEQRWQAICERDQAWDGIFVFAVRTTGVYCRPSCPSRRANRDNVLFFPSPEQARAAGYRACKRCKPDDDNLFPHGAAVVEACRTIQGAEAEPDLTTLAAAARLSPGHFQRVFKAQVGMSPKRYAMALRKKRLRDGLQDSSTVTQAIYDAGYGSASRAYADNVTPGLPPRRHKAGARGEIIRYANAHTSLGNVLVATTDRGICLVEFVNQAEARNRLASYFPQAHLEEAKDQLKDWMREVVARVDAPDKKRANTVLLPLDIRGTAFQEKVWQALSKIPAGQTVSYRQLAETIGQPKAARAVAGACAANRLAVLVPCHRVIRGSGDLAGYKWGVERKRALLKGEA